MKHQITFDSQYKPKDKIRSTGDLQVNDIIEHRARKTLTFKVVEFKNSKVIVRRFDEWGNPVEKYRGYAIGNSDIRNGAIRCVGYMTPVDGEPEDTRPKVTRGDTKLGAKGEKVYTLEELNGCIFGVHFGLRYNNILREFENLAGEFSPENLTCDGELSDVQVQRKRMELLAKWNLLEQYIGVKVQR